MNEEWKPVVGYEGLYEVSDQGRVRSLDRPQHMPARCGGGQWMRKGRVMSPKLSTHFPPRLCVELYHAGKGVWRNVHTLVLEAFVGPRPSEYEACHNDGNPANNVKSNLRWDTRKANKEDQRRHGTYAHGARHGMSKINGTDVERMRDIRRSGASITATAKWIGMSRPQTGQILSGQQWKHL